MHEGFFGPEIRYFWKRTGKLETGDHENVLAQIGFVVTHSQVGREKIFTDSRSQINTCCAKCI